jgi:transmembrane sensor
VALSETDTVRWEAAQWVERRMDDGPFDQRAFDAWLASNPRHQSVFEAMWRRTMGSQMDTALSAYERQRTLRRALPALGAAVLALAGGHQAMPFIEGYFAPVKEYQVADRSMRTVALSDGTKLVLAGGASLKVRYTRHERLVELTHGTIFAEVVHDKDRPFRVDTGETRIVDIGTSFEVVSEPSLVRVTVASGAVRFGRNRWFGRSLDLGANQAATLDQMGLNRIADANSLSVAAWRNEWAEYKGAPLRQIIADLQSLSPLPIKIADAELANRRVSGRIRLTDPVGQLENLAIVQSFRIERTEGGFLLSKS